MNQYITPLCIENAQRWPSFSLNSTHNVGVLNEKKCNNIIVTRVIILLLTLYITWWIFCIYYGFTREYEKIYTRKSLSSEYQCIYLREHEEKDEDGNIIKYNLYRATKNPQYFIININTINEYWGVTNFGGREYLKCWGIISSIQPIGKRMLLPKRKRQMHLCSKNNIIK